MVEFSTMKTITNLPYTENLIHRTGSDYLGSIETEFQVVEGMLAIDPRDDILRRIHNTGRVSAIAHLCFASSEQPRDTITLDFKGSELEGIRFKNTVMPTKGPFSVLSLSRMVSEPYSGVELVLSAAGHPDEVEFKHHQEMSGALSVVALDTEIIRIVNEMSVQSV